MQVVEKFLKLEDFIASNDLGSRTAALRDEFAISSSEELKKWIENSKTAGKVLRLGIVGRVKAGKSSLLNALFFDGKDILPKAATPMTAALTILEYDENLSASIDFFSAEDLEEIKKEHAKYQAEFQRRVQEKVEEKRKRAESKKDQATGAIDFNEAKEREIAQKSVERELKNTTLYASYEQHEKIKNSGINPSTLPKNLDASSIEDLKDVLQDYVGAEGKYMPFTKSVTIKLNLETLKDMQIIDSPGINDPIVSREERTKKPLKDCDAVFLISPAGQFLSIDDLNLLDRISDKEGICEFRILASQTDNQLFTNAREEGGGTISGALDYIRSTLSANFKSTMTDFKQERTSEKIKQTIDKLISSPLLLTSGACYAMLKSFGDKSSWDSNMQKVWENLNDDYKDFFANDATARENLGLIANIDTISQNLDDIRANKDKIIQDKIAEYTKAKTATFKSYAQGIEKILQESIDELNSKDKATIEKQIKELGNKKAKASFELSETYDNECLDFKIKLDEGLKAKKAEYFKEGQEALKDSQGTEERSYKVSASSWYNPFSWGSTKTEYETINIVHAGDVRNALDVVICKVQDLLNNEIAKERRHWKEERLNKNLIGTLRKTFDDEDLDWLSISKMIKSIVDSIKTPEFDYSDKLPDELKKSGKLQRYEAEEFIEKARDFMSEFAREVTRDINNFTKNLERNLKAKDVAKDIFASYEEELKRLESELGNKELAIEKYTNMLQNLKEINNA
ncbi:hypothetical protein BKN38_09700 [Helicobacter sp. CLO-3]|uniref:dynamin family protein n=1 Tax=unclassified Helicobacter TaxID=2593540 RepID=UPI000805F69E|nr:MULTISPECIES: dynamin family protein [unclassified Helicobacter]OBV28519.1 hypothetical protein BA723_09210 [Helicobacter sp. CLO-3]OHU81106.1 hypothetical protein BKN38_09700 [Helicobacter sp. CLO-3]